MQRDIVEFLNIKLQEQSEQVIRVDARIAVLEREKQEMMARYDLEISESQAAYKLEIEQKNLELTQCKAELAQLNDFKSKKVKHQHCIPLKVQKDSHLK